MSKNERDIARFLNIKKVNDASPETIKNQAFILGQLNKFLEGKPFKETTEEDIFAVFTRKKEGGASPRSLQQYKMVIKSFYRFLYDLPRHQYPKQVWNLNSGNNKRKAPIRPDGLFKIEDFDELSVAVDIQVARVTFYTGVLNIKGSYYGCIHHEPIRPMIENVWSEAAKKLSIPAWYLDEPLWPIGSKLCSKRPVIDAQSENGVTETLV